MDNENMLGSSQETPGSTGSANEAERSMAAKSGRRFPSVPENLARRYRELLESVGWQTRNPHLTPIGLTSFFPREGVSTIAKQLAVVAANAGTRTVLIQTSLPRTPLLETNRSNGFADFLTTEDVSSIFETQIANLSYLSPGTRDLQTLPRSTYLSGINLLTIKFDLVILDLGALQPESTSFPWIGCINTLLLVSAASTTPNDIAMAQQFVENRGGILSGLIRNKIVANP